MNQEKPRKKKYMSIYDCSICRKLPQRLEPDTNNPIYYVKERVQETARKEYDKLFPKEAKELEDIISHLPERNEEMPDVITYKKCPICGIIYYYDYSYVWGDAIAITNHSYHKLRRCTPSHVKELFVDSGISGEYEELLREEWEELKEKYDQTTKDYTNAIKTKSKTLNWQIRKYMIEVLTELYLHDNDWNGFYDVLLENDESVVRVEAANDIFMLATEPYTPRRNFTGHFHEMAKDFLLMQKNERVQKLVQIFTESLFDEKKTHKPHPEYRKISVRRRAFNGLSRIRYRGFDISHAIPSIAKWFLEGLKWLRGEAKYFFHHALDENSSYAALILEEIDKLGLKVKPNEFKYIHRKCKTILNKQASKKKKGTKRKKGKKRKKRN